MLLRMGACTCSRDLISFCSTEWNEKIILSPIVNLGSMAHSQRSISIGHCYVQHAGAEYHGTDNTPCQLLLMPSGKPTLDATRLSYERAQILSSAEKILSTKKEDKFLHGAVVKLEEPERLNKFK